MRGYLIPPDEADAAESDGGHQLRDWEALAVDAVGQVIEFWGFKRNQGRVWALLYLRGRPAAASEIQAELGLSKGAVSMITRELERWGVVRRVRAPASEVWLFEAEQDLMEMVRRVLREREASLVGRVRSDLAVAEERAAADPRVAREELDRLRRLRRLADLVDRSLAVFLRTAHLDASGVANVLRQARAPARRSQMSPAPVEKSVITCDLEGRIETFNEGAARMFGWRPDEIIGKKRVSLFSPGLVVLGHVGAWLATAQKQGEYRGRTVFVRKDGTRFAADIRITPTMKGGEQIGYCGVTEALPDVRPEDAMPPISFGTHAMRWLVVTRAPFLSATLVPMLVAAAAVWRRSGTLAWSCFGLALLAGLALNVAANVWNDYFDGVSGTDEANADYFLPFSGGSRAVELGLITPRGQLVLGFAALTVAAGAGLALLATRGPWLLAFGAVGALIAWCYTAPPFRLAARGGLGELSVAVAFGPLLTAGTTFALVGASTLGDWLLGLPVGLLTAAILYVNEFPDAVSDAATGKRHLIVVLGKRTARWGYAALVGLAFAAVAVGAALHLVPATALLALAAAPLAVSATRTVFRHYEDRALVRACARTIQLQAAAGLLLAVGLLLMR